MQVPGRDVELRSSGHLAVAAVAVVADIGSVDRVA